MDKEKLPTFDNVRCGTCKEVLADSSLDKQPLGPDRLSVFCGRCQRFLFIYDPKASAELKEMLETRKRIEVKNEQPRDAKARIRKEVPPTSESI